MEQETTRRFRQVKPLCLWSEETDINNNEMDVDGIDLVDARDLNSKTTSNHYTSSKLEVSSDMKKSIVAYFNS